LKGQVDRDITDLTNLFEPGEPPRTGIVHLQEVEIPNATL